MSYRLSQVEGALHALMMGTGRTARKQPAIRPSLTFRNQIKRLLEIDRARLRAGKSGHNVGPAFFDQLPDGSGTDASYDAFGTFCLAIGLELLLYGFKQREVIEKLATMRTSLDCIYKEISQTSKSDGPAYERARQADDADGPYVFLVLDKLDLPRPGRGELMANATDDWGPAIQRGRKRLMDRVDHLLKHGARSVFFVELREIAVRINELLPLQEIHRRGRS